MVSVTKLIPSELKRKNSKSPVVKDKTKTSGSSVLSRRIATEGKHVSSLGTEVRRGYVSAMKLEHKKRKKSLEEKVKIQKLNNSKLIVPEEMSSVIGLKSSRALLLDKVLSSVSAMLQLRDAKTSSGSKPVSLFMDDGQPIYLVVQCVRVPKMCNQHFRFCLPHPLIDKSSDVCLFVPDLKKGRNEDHEPTIEHYKELLEKNNITGISQVMPLRQVKVEYDQYELRRRLVSQFDLFLSDGRIAGHMLHLLGKEVYRKRKLPVPVNMRAENLKKEIETALCKTLMMMNANGNKAALKVGHSKQTVMHIAENIMAVADCLSKRYPGGWDNIRSLHIHLQDCPLIPVYITLKSSNEVEVPVMKPVIPKKAKPVEGELTTFPGTHVTVLPSGEVVVKKIGLTKEDKEMGMSDSDWEEFNSDEEMDTGSGDEIPVASTDEKTKGESQPGSEEAKESEDIDDRDEHVAEAAEDAYLSDWRKQWNANIKENNKRKESETNNGEEEPEEKKRKIIKKKKQTETKGKTETIGKKKHMNHVAIKMMEKSQPDSKKCKLSRKNMTKSAGGLSIPKGKSVHKSVNKGKKIEHKKVVSTKLAKKKLKVQKSKQIISHQNISVK